MKKTLLFLFVILLCNAAKAQYPYYDDDRLRIGVQLGADYDVPLGKLSFTYKPTISPNISVLLSKSEKFTVNLTVGYHVYQPKDTAFYYLIDDGENYGVDTFSQYKVKSAYLGFMYNFPLAEAVKVSGGFNFGLYLTDYEMTSNDRQQSTISGRADKNVYFAPKIGLSFNITDAVALHLTAKYNIFSPTGKNDGFSPAVFNKDLGVIYTSWSAGTGISYQF